MTIKRSIIITGIIFIVSTALGLLKLLFNINIVFYQHIIGVYDILSNLIIYLFVVIYLYRTNNKYLLKPTEKARNWSLLILVIVTSCGIQMVDLPFFQWQTLSNEYFSTKFRLLDYSNYTFELFQIYGMFSVLIIAPIFEEIIFRYFFFGGLYKKYNLLIALGVSSFLFAIIHISSLRNIIPSFYFGIFSSLIYYRTRNISYSILFHLTYNILWSFTYIFAKEYDNLIHKIGFGIGFWLIFVIGIFLCIFGMQRINTISKNSM